MRSCLHSVSLPDLPLVEVFRRAKKAGYKAVELNAETLPWAKAHITPDVGEADRRAVLIAAHEMDISLPALGAHIPMVDANPAGRKAALVFVMGCVDLARDLEIPVVHILSGPLAPNGTKGEGWPWFAEAVSAATEHAGRAKVTLAIEAIAGHMFCSVDDYHRLRADLPGVPFRINFDPSHLIVQGENPMRVIDELGDQIVHVHLKDGAGRFPDFIFPPLGRGNIDFPTLTEGLHRAGYAAAMSVEYEAQVYGYALSDDEILLSGRDFMSNLGIP